MKRYRLVLVLVVLMTTSAAVAAVAPVTAGGADGARAGSTQSMVTLTVTVTDRVGNGISNVDLTATWDGGSTTATTASNGKAFVDVPEGARVEIAVSHDDYTRNHPYVVEDAQEEDVTVVASLKASATVTVVDDGEPVENARVAMTKTDQGETAASGRTGADGTFDSGTLEQGTYRVLAVKEGYEFNETTVDVFGSTEATVAIEEGSVTVEFSVRDDHFDEPRPVEGATVEIEGPTTASVTTSGEGTASIGLPVNARYTITVRKDGYGTVRRTVNVGQEPADLSFTINREPVLSVAAVNSRIVVGEAVQLTVTDEYGERVEGATITVDGEAVGQTDADGVYRATVDSAGEHVISARANGVTSGEITVRGVSEGGEATPTATSSPAATATEGQLPDFSQPTFAMKVGVAAVGVIFAFLVVRRLL